MAYAIIVDDIGKKFWDCDGGWENLTWNAISDDECSLRVLYEEAGFGDDEYMRLDDEEKVIYIRESDEMYKMSIGFCPVVNYVHVLQETPTKYEVLKVHKKAPDVVILKDGLGNFFIGLLKCDVDLTEQIEYAYMTIDGCVPECFRIDDYE